MKYYTEIVLHVFGDTEEVLLRSLIPELKERFNMNVTIGEALIIPSLAYDSIREQYLSTVFLEEMQDQFRSDPHIHLGVTDVDLYVPHHDYVIGEASPATWTAIFSTFRLRPTSPGPASVPTLRQRVAIEAVHELGHILGLPHCKNPQCVMSIACYGDDWERKGSKFCATHQKEVDDLMNEWSSQAPTHIHY